MKRIHILITGKVQGISFRYYTKKKAEELQIKGWVKNLPNGDVEIVVEGNNSNITSFMDWCKTGPSLANVKNIAINEEQPTNEFSTFSIY